MDRDWQGNGEERRGGGGGCDGREWWNLIRVVRG